MCCLQSYPDQSLSYQRGSNISSSTGGAFQHSSRHSALGPSGRSSWHSSSLPWPDELQFRLDQTRPRLFNLESGHQAVSQEKDSAFRIMFWNANVLDDKKVEVLWGRAWEMCDLMLLVETGRETPDGFLGFQCVPGTAPLARGRYWQGARHCCHGAYQVGGVLVNCQAERACNVASFQYPWSCHLLCRSRISFPSQVESVGTSAVKQGKLHLNGCDRM